MHYLTPLDATFLYMDTTRTPMHVGALMTFRLPDNAPPDFVRQLMAKMREKPFMPKPFDCRLAEGWMAGIAPAWVDAKLDMDYHLRHSALPYPGGERELGKLVERLHSHPLDMTRPLWECHLIEGLENRRYALYFKAHHCAIDGMGAVRMLRKWLTPDPTDMSGLSAIAAKPDHAFHPTPKKSLLERLRKPVRIAAKQAQAFSELVKTLKLMQEGEDSSGRLALATPRSRFNVHVSQQRRLATQILDLERLKHIAHATGTTVNDVLLAVCGSSVRRYLVENESLPEHTLLASVPMGLARSEEKTGNAVAGFVAPLGTNLEDPLERLRWINRVTTRSKHELQDMSPAAQAQFALVGLSPLIIGQITGLLPKIPPLFNFVVSNVNLSQEPLYLMGSELEAIYPVSFLFDGYALNITLVGYNNKVAVGILGCREAVPSLQRLAVYTSRALNELEDAIEQPSDQ
jgi:diacylglycerol O-acyltransferase